MASCSFPDIGEWIQSLPPIAHWREDFMFTSICSSSSSSSSSSSIQPSLNLVASKSPKQSPPSISFCIVADFRPRISLWTSKTIKLRPKSTKLSEDQELVSSLLTNLIKDVLNYGADKKRNHSLRRIPSLRADSRDALNLAFLTLALLVCIYESPTDPRSQWLSALKIQLVSPRLREASKVLMRVLGSNVEEQWMRSLNLAITNWIVEFGCGVNPHGLKAPSPLFSYAVSMGGLWKVQLYCPVIAMEVGSSSGSADEKLQFSLRYHQLEGVLQFNYRVVVREDWIDVMLNTDNIRCDVTRLVNESLLNSRGAGGSEKHFPSRISLQLTPSTLQSDVISISVGKSSDNPAREIGTEKALEASIDPQVGLTASVAESVTLTLKPWKFEQSVDGNTGILNWFLHDAEDGKEVFSSKPSKMALIHPRAWFKNRYSSAHRPFTRRGGVIFAGDVYGDRVRWKMCRSAAGKAMDWELKGWVWVTYWPNKHRTFYNETRKLEFTEIFHLMLA